MPVSVLPNLVPSALVMSGVASAWTRRALRLAHQFGAGGEVAPLVGAARLQRAAVAAEQLEVVHALQHLVAELGVRDALVGVEAARDGVLGDHGAEPEVLAHVAQQLDRGHVLGPVEVVDHARGVVALEGHVRLDLRADALHPLVDEVHGVEHAVALILGVADEAGGAAHEQQRLVAGVLEPTHGEDLHEVADVQARAPWGRSRSTP